MDCVIDFDGEAFAAVDPDPCSAVVTGELVCVDCKVYVVGCVAVDVSECVADTKALLDDVVRAVAGDIAEVMLMVIVWESAAVPVMGKPKTVLTTLVNITDVIMK